MKKRRKSQIIATLIFISVASWIMSGVLTNASDKSEQEVRSNPVSKVRVSAIHAIEKTKIVSLFGVTEASRQVDLRAEVQGKVIEIPAKEGSTIKKGEVIIEIEKRDLEAQLARRKAEVRQRQIDYNVAQKLMTKGLSAEATLAENMALLEEAKAEMIQAQINLDNTTIRAPYDGWLEQINVEVGTLVGPNIRVGQGTDTDGSNIATVIDRDPMIIVGYVSERDIKDISIGTSGFATLVTGEKVEGIVTFMGTKADRITRTFKVEMEVANPQGTIISGVTTNIEIPVKTAMAHHIPSSVLSLDKDGVLGIKTLELTSKESNRLEGKVKFYPVDIFDNDNEGLWVENLPESLKLITVGQAFVAEGEIVEATVPTEDSGS